MYLAFKFAKNKFHNHRQQQKTKTTTTTASSSLSSVDPEDRFLSQSRDGATPLSTAGHDSANEREKRTRRSYRLRIILALFLPSTLYALDTTIIASALPSIATSFNQFAQLNLIITCFTLTSCTFLPLFAQACDIFGRYWSLQSSLLITIIGSAICTACPTHAFGLLLFGRALQGVGVAGINICVRTILADRVGLKEYTKNVSIFAIVQGVGFGVGPVAGGYLSKESWRWCFAINLPVGVVAMGIVGWMLRGDVLVPAQVVDGDGTRQRLGMRLKTIDYGGQILFLLGLGLLVLGFTWAGGTHGWDSVQVLVPLVVGSVVTLGWLVYEWAMVPGRVMARVWPKQKAMMPWELLTTRDVGLLFYINCTVGAAMFAVMYFMDLYFTLVMGHDAGKAGVALLYFLPGLGAGVYMTSFWINVWPRQTFPVLFFGTTVSAVGTSVLSWACHRKNLNLIYGMMALTGFGVGTNMNPGSLHGLAYFPGMTAAITCIASFATPFGGTVALTIMSTVFNNKSGINHGDPKRGIVWGFIALLPIMWTAVLVTTLLGNVWVGREGGHEVLHQSWFWSLIRRKKLQRVSMAQIDGGKDESLLLSKVPSAGRTYKVRGETEGGRV
ncbi:major facilitator superfamily domain-containing protein [Cladorrhinum sp. PSN332]|nr:major facilitator superfamily domain-containing protein [Cladorrhinum sp. PSN332]